MEHLWSSISLAIEAFTESVDYGKCTLDNSIEDSCYSRYSPMASGLFFCYCFVVYSFVWSVVGQNVSKVDQIWSITPVVYVWHFFLHQVFAKGVLHFRALVIAVLVTAWGTRLTYNFWRKGGYGNLITHEEDYRWPIIRKQINNPILFLLFNLTFIATYQNILLYLIAAPVYEVVISTPTVGLGDIIVAMMFAVLLALESLADEEHFQFQSLKYALAPEQRASNEWKDIRDGFYQSGLFKLSRHPNYFAEQSMWVCVYLFSITHKGAAYFNWSIIGCVLLILLFQGSMAFSESITKSKYPEYSTYQLSTPMCIPDGKSVTTYVLTEVLAKETDKSNKKKK